MTSFSTLTSLVFAITEHLHSHNRPSPASTQHHTRTVEPVADRALFKTKNSVATMRTALVFLLISCILLGNFILFYFLGIPRLFQELVENHRKKKRASSKQEWIEMQNDVQQRAKERRRKEERLRWERNAARKRSGFYAELEQAYNKA